MKYLRMRLVKSLGFLALFVVAVAWADDDAAAAPVADLDGRAKLLVSKQVSLCIETRKISFDFQLKDRFSFTYRRTLGTFCVAPVL